ncbi:hypothetical protein AB0M35_28145 [Micromonospora sp. NPDC051196]|uniref:hypothetical protein n=1 Tax=Micromonospora sp. NPDC051196 TaxID=3155281 RepID=UPI003446333D
MAKHRAPVDSRRSRPEETDSGAFRPSTKLSWPAPRQDRVDGGPAPQQERSLNAAGVLGRTTVVGVARVPATSRLTPPGREIRNQGPRPASPRRPAVVPAPAGRHRRAAEPDC